MRSLRFNATTSLIDFGEHQSAAPPAYTLLTLVYPIGSGESGFGIVFIPNAANALSPGALGILHNVGAPKISFRGNSSGSANQPIRDTNANTVVYGQWQHIATTWASDVAATSLTAYFGQPGRLLTAETTYTVSTNGSGSAVSVGAAQMMIGNRSDGARTFNGDIAYVAQWSRALSLEELRVAQQFGPLAVRAGLVFYWNGERDLGPFRIIPKVVIALAQGVTIPPQFNPAPKRQLIVKAPAAGVFIKPVGDNFRLAGAGGLAG